MYFDNNLVRFTHSREAATHETRLCGHSGPDGALDRVWVRRQVHWRCGRDESGFVALFDGKGFTGWKSFGSEPDTWKAENGLLVGTGKGGGWLGTRRDFGDFVLKLEFKLSPESNSGVYLRAPADQSHISRTGLEIQLLDERHARYRDIQPWQRTGSIYSTSPPPCRGFVRPSGQWNTMEIRARGAARHHHAQRHEGRRRPPADTSTPSWKRAPRPESRVSGRIGLQTHNGPRGGVPQPPGSRSLASTRPVG